MASEMEFVNYKQFVENLPVASSYATGDKSVISNGTNGPRQMPQVTSEQIAAQNALADNVAPEFVPNSTTTIAGRMYVYGGSVYMAKEAYQGPWDASKFTATNVGELYDKISKIQVLSNSVPLSLAVSTEHFLLKDVGGTLSITYTTDYSNYIFRVQPGEKYIWKCYQNDSSTLSVAFLKAPFVRNQYYISGIQSVSGTNEYEFTIPNDCNYIIVNVRALGNYTAQLSCTVNAYNISSQVLEKDFAIVADDYSSGIVYNGIVDDGWLNGYIKGSDHKFYSEDAYRSFIFKCNGYERIEAYVAMIGTTENAISFYSSDKPNENCYISGVPTPSASSSPQYVYAAVPAGCKSIIVTTRVLNLATPIIKFFTSFKKFVFDYASNDFLKYAEERRNRALQQRWSWSGDDGVGLTTLTTLLWFSDIHGKSLAFEKMMKLKNDFFGGFIDDVVNSGDTCSDYLGDYTGFLTSDVITVIGNHEAYKNNNHDHVDSPVDYYDVIIKDNVANWGVIQPPNAAADGKCYFYKDYATSSIRVIFLDSQNYSGFGGFFNDGGVQNAWFESVLADAISNNLSVVVVAHYPPNDIEQEWENNGFCTPKDHFIAATFPGCAAVENFIGSGGKFICWMCGHQHDDQFGLSGSTHPFPVIQLASENTARNENTARQYDSLSEHNFNIITFDTSKKLIKVTKFGCNVDGFMRNRNSMCYDYENKRLITAT